MKYHTMRFLVDPKRGTFITKRIPYSNAKKNVELTREDIDALNGMPGWAVECMNVECSFRLKALFPHDVIIVEFTDSRAWIVDRVDKNKQPIHLVKYVHTMGAEQKAFDVPGGKARMIRKGLVQKNIKLCVPRPYEKHKTGPHLTTGRKQKNPAINKGSWARAQRAGLINISA